MLAFYNVAGAAVTYILSTPVSAPDDNHKLQPQGHDRHMVDLSSMTLLDAKSQSAYTAQQLQLQPYLDRD